MRSSVSGTDAERCLPRLAPGWEQAAPALNAVEGFLLSRIDGTTPWDVLREIGGLPPEEADLALESWVRAGLVVLEKCSARTHGTPSASSAPVGKASAEPEGVVDPSLDLDEELQRSILAFDARLADASYHEILGVEIGTDPREIKRAYFQLSKRYHPDRYFRRNVGSHQARLDRIFKHLALAYELLSDSETRAEIEKSMSSQPQPQLPGDATPQGYRVPTRMENLRRLRSRFKVPEQVLTERRFRARQFFQAARADMHAKRWLEAASSARLAIAFDPWNPEFREAFAGFQAEVHSARALDLLAQADGAAQADALRLLDEAVHYRPADAALHARAGALAADLGKLEDAQDYATSACELEPESAAHHLLLCRVQRRLGDRKAALEALSAAEKIAPRDSEVVEMRKLIRGS